MLAEAISTMRETSYITSQGRSSEGAEEGRNTTKASYYVCLVG